jgi:hypothetical protein
MAGRIRREHAVAAKKPGTGVIRLDYLSPAAFERQLYQMKKDA